MLIQLTRADLQQMLADAASASLPHDWRLYSALVLLPLVASLVGSFVGAFARKSGEALATTRGFESVLKQLEATTRLSEAIRTEVQARHGHVAVVREKCEQQVMACFAVDEWLEAARSEALGGRPAGSPSSFSRVEALHLLYFSDVEEFDAVRHAYIHYARWILAMQADVMELQHQSRKMTELGRDKLLAGFDYVGRPYHSAMSAYRAAVAQRLPNPR